MNMEGVFEDESQLRRCVENELLSDTNISPDQALKVYRKFLTLFIHGGNIYENRKAVQRAD